jgi:hypothetical protein
MRRLRLLAPLLAALALAGSIPTASAMRPKQDRNRPPTLLWLAFPLKERPDASAGRTVRRDAAAAPAATGGQFHRPVIYLLVGFFVSAGIAVTLLMLLWAKLSTTGGRLGRLTSGRHGSRRWRAPVGDHLRHALARERSRLQAAARPWRPEILAAAAPDAAGPRGREPDAERRAEPRPAQRHAPQPPAAPKPPGIMRALGSKPVPGQQSEHVPELERESEHAPEPESETEDVLGALLAAERAAIISVGKEQELKLEARERAAAEAERELRERTARLEAEREELEKRELQLTREREQAELALASERGRLAKQAQEALELERARLATAGRKLEERERELAAGRQALAAERTKLEVGHAERLRAVAAKRAELEAPQAEVEQKRAELEKRELQLARERERAELALASERRRLAEQAQEALELERARLASTGKELGEREREIAAKENALQARLAEIEREGKRELAAGREAVAAEKAKLESEHAERLRAVAAERAELEAAQASLEQKRAELLETLRPNRTTATKSAPKKTPTRRRRGEAERTRQPGSPGRQQSAAPSREDEEPAPQKPSTAPSGKGERPRRASTEVCEIALWRGYVKWHFYTSQLGSYRLPTALTSEPFLRLRDEKNPTPAAQQAFAGLIDELTGNGWVVVATGPRWYDYRLERS